MIMKQTLEQLIISLTYNTLEYLETKKEHYKDSAIEQMQKIAKIYHFQLKKKHINKKAFACIKEVLSNKQGYPTHINNLYSVL